MPSTPTLANNIGQVQTSTDYRFTFARADDGVGVLTLQHLVTIKGVATWQTVATQPNAGWDDAIPWAAGTYNATFGGGSFVGGPFWNISDVAQRTAIRLHQGTVAQTPSQALEGCIGATLTFINACKTALVAAGETAATYNIPLVVTDTTATALFPLNINETISATNLTPGQSATLTLSLAGGGASDGVTKDIYV